jgi:acyl-coenzyme A thioesterase PaaI-like protein
VSDPDTDRLAAIFEPLAQSVRELIDATVRTETDAATVAAAIAEIDSATARLRSVQFDGPVALQPIAASRRTWGNAVIGLRNPIAPPLLIKGEIGRVWADFHLGAAYEGPPGLVHGGVIALVLDHILGEAASDRQRPRFTGTISVRYLRGTPLGPLHTEATVVRTEGVKTYAVGHIADDEGPTVEAEGVFILPRWARD